MNKPLSASSLFVVAALTLAGCGGGGGGGKKSSSSTTPVAFTLDWAARSKATQAPASALSARLILAGGGADGGDLVTTVDRATAPAAYSQSYTTPTKAKTGTRSLTVRFYSQAGGGGVVVAEGTAQVTIAKDGSGIGTITVANKVATVTVPAGQLAAVGASKQLTFEARDAAGALVAVTAGSANFASTGTSGAFTLTPDGLATGVSAGSGTVTASVDGVTSAAATVTVTQSTVTSVTVASGQRVPVGGQVQLAYQAKDAQGNVVAVPASSVTFANVQNDPDLSLTAGGLATGVQTGTASVAATVNGVTSPVAIVTVFQP